MESYFKLWIIILNMLSLVRCWRDLPRELYDLCPYSDICNRTSSRKFDAGLAYPCCSSCSCDEHCGLRLDCCFRQLDKFHLVDNGIVACIEPAMRFINESVGRGPLTNHFYMKTTCENKNVRCRLKDEFGYSLIAPVSSKETKQIYVNKDCALCNNINSSSITEWDYIFLSDFEPVDSAVTFLVEENIQNKMGSIIFVPPPGEDWYKKYCYSETSFIEVSNCSLSDEWLSICEDLHAPLRYTSRVGFRNVFCALCSGVSTTKLPDACTPPYTRVMSRRFTVLINHSFIEASKLNDLAMKSVEKRKHTCPDGYVKHTKGTCLVVHCPEGMLKTANGCQYFGLKWYTPAIVIQVKLTPKQADGLTVSKLPWNRPLGRQNPFQWLIIPCKSGLFSSAEVYVSTVREIAMVNETTEVNGQVTSFVVRLWKTVGMVYGINPSDLIPVLGKCVNATWTVKLGNESYKFKGRLDQYSFYVQDGQQKLLKYPQQDVPFSKRYESFVRPQLYTLVERGSSNDWDSVSAKLMLKKPFFCNQVRVPNTDVETRFGEIHIISKNVSLCTNEFIANTPLLNGDVRKLDYNRTTFSVCVEDFDPSYSEKSGYMSMTRGTNSGRFLLTFMLVWYKIIMTSTH